VWQVPVFKALRQRLMMLPAGAVRLDSTGFTDGTRVRLEEIMDTFAGGYRAALDDLGAEDLSRRLADVGDEMRGFAVEGAAMCLTLVDGLTPWSHRLDVLSTGVAASYPYTVHVGAGLAMARLPFPIEATLRRLDPVLRWLAVDGYGFYEGLFRTASTVEAQRVPRRIRGYARRAFDQGVGRSLWFVTGGSVPRLAHAIGGFPTSRQADLWGGIGLACCYTGMADAELSRSLLHAAWPYRGSLAQGAAFAAKARARAGYVPCQSQTACRILTGRSVADAAELTDQALRDLGGDDGEPAFERWRRRIQEALLASSVGEPEMQKIS
jgi:hypothetical protein